MQTNFVTTFFFPGILHYRKLTFFNYLFDIELLLFFFWVPDTPSKVAFL